MKFAFFAFYQLFIPSKVIVRDSLNCERKIIASKSRENQEQVVEMNQYLNSEYFLDVSILYHNCY